jgi:radical SAM/Cys-rich protein
MTMNGNDFEAVLDSHRLTLKPVDIETLWINITRRCNQACSHCHVDSSPRRNEEMDLATIKQCLKIIGSLSSCRNLDITGGAPELNPHFEYLVTKAREMGKRVIVRHNLTITPDGDERRRTSKTHLPAFFAGNGVELLASLPHFERTVTDSTRGKGVFDKSIEALKQLNAIGYGQTDEGLILNLVSNVEGAISPEERLLLEASFKRELREEHGIVFNRLYAVTNMPVNRFLVRLKHSNGIIQYMDRLAAAFDPASIPNLACRYLVSVGYDGRLYDCDFNQMLDMPVHTSEAMTIFDFDRDVLLERRIRSGAHCFGCTAGGGSS